jgi:exosortase
MSEQSASIVNNEQRRSVSRRSRLKKEEIGWSEIISLSGWLKVGIFSFLILWLYWNEIRYMMIQTWIGNGNWSHGFLIPLFSLYFLHQRKEKIAKTPIVHNWFGLVIIVLSVIGYMASIYPLKIGYPKLLSILGVLIGLVLLNCGWRMILITWLPILFLFFAMPIPDRWYEALTIPMRIWASQIAVIVMNFIPGMDLTATGVVIEGTYKNAPIQLSVAEACAGMRLMMAFLALGVAMAYLSDRPYWHRIILVISTLPIALLCNFSRVIITGVLYAMVNPIFAQGGFHTTLGLIMLPVAFFLYWLIAGVLNRIYEDADVEEAANG